MLPPLSFSLLLLLVMVLLLLMILLLKKIKTGFKKQSIQITKAIAHR